MRKINKLHYFTVCNGRHWLTYKNTKTKTRKSTNFIILPYVRVAIGGDRGIVGSRDRGVNSLASGVDYVGVAFGGEPLASVFMNRSFDCNERRTKAQQSENRTGTVEPLHWNKASGATETGSERERSFWICASNELSALSEEREGQKV